MTKLAAARRRQTFVLLLAATVLAGFCIYAVAPWLATALAYLSPALLLLAALGARRYPGERALLALGSKYRRAPRRGIRDRAPRLPRTRAVLPRGGRLIATSLAVRPPPAARALALS
jgi:hypothetical protein